MTRLLVDMTPELAGGHEIAMPLVPVQMRRGDLLGWQHTALVDSGSAFTLARIPVAALLGLDADAVRASADRVELTAAAGPGAAAWGWDVDLYLGRGALDARLSLPGARVYFTDWPLAGFDVLLGQHDALERLSLRLVNHPPRRHFILHEPSTSAR